MKSGERTSYFSGLTKNTFLLALTSLFADISTEMLYPVLPIFLTQTPKAGGSIVGIVEGVAETTQNLVQGFSGWLSDKWQKRKGIAVFGYLLAAISKPLIGLATGWPLVLGARFMDRLGSGIRSAPRDALIAASTDEKNRGKAFGLEGAGDNLGAFIGPLIAVALLFLLQDDLRTVFYLSIIPGVLAVLMILAIAATIGIFLPSFLFVALLNPLIKKLRQSSTMAAFPDTVNVASVALILVVCVELGRISITNWKTATIAIAGFIVTFIFRKMNTAFVILGGALAGYLLTYI